MSCSGDGVSYMDEAAWEDSTMDAIALVEAAGRDDALGCGAILRNMDAGAVAVNLVKLVAAVLEDNARGHAVCADPECWRDWAVSAVNRP